MPKMQGDRLLSLARELNKDLGLVLLSGHVMALEELQYVDRDDIVVIHKPTPKRDQLVKLIHSALRAANKV